MAGPNTYDGALHHLNYAQKIFEVGDCGTVGVAMWGMGSIGELSHRTLIAKFADEYRGRFCSSMEEIAEAFVTRVWDEYQSRLATVLAAFKQLEANPNRTPEEESEFRNISETLNVGFCIGGYLPHDRFAKAFEILLSPELKNKPKPTLLDPGSAYFWGCPNIIHRVLYGCDPTIVGAILASGKWTGTDQDLYQLVLKHRLSQPFDLPLREAIDWVNSVIYTTIKAMKFSHYLPVCGGPIELAVISTDRRFRWVRHKSFDEALG